MMIKIHHSHSKPSAGRSSLLAAVWQATIQISPISITLLTGGHRSCFSDCFYFLLKFREFAGDNHEEHVANGHKGGGLLQVTA